MRFEWTVAVRYLRARRKQTVISVITVISILGVAAGVAALIIALAINNGFQSTLQSSLLSATAHVNILERNPTYGIEHWEQLVPKLLKIPHVTSASPGLYGQVAFKGPLVGAGGVIKGVLLDKEEKIPDLLRRLKAGSIRAPSGLGRSEVILGSRLAEQLGLRLHSPVDILSFQGRLTPLGMMPSLFRFRVGGIFETGLYELDSNWAFTSLADAQRVLDLNDVVNTIELKLDDLFGNGVFADVDLKRPAILLEVNKPCLTHTAAGFDATRNSHV